MLIVSVLAPAAAALLLAITPRNILSRWVIAVPAAIFLYFLTQTGVSPPQSVSIPWAPSLGVNLSFSLDGLGLLFCLIVSGIGTLVLLYAGGYFEDVSDYIRFSSYTLLFMSAMLGIVLSANLLLVFVFWEITSITSYLLIGFKHESEDAREGARRALLVTAGGGLAMLAGFLLLGSIAGTFEIPELLERGEAIRQHSLYTPTLLLILLGAFTKSAQWPFHFWLPGAMEAPTPASTYLHSATMVKAGVFLLARLGPALNDTPEWTTLLAVVGIITFLYAGVVALRQTDLKAILAYSTVSWLGVLVALQSSSSEYAAIALSVGVLAHALYKASLFFTAGSIDHAAGTRDLTLLGGLARKMPFTAIGACIAAVSMAGIPPLLGFLAKETLKAASLYEGLPGVIATLFPVAAVIGSALTVAVAFRVLWDSFFAKPAGTPPHAPHEVSPAMWIGALTLGVFSVVLPLLIPQTLDPLVSMSVAAVRQESASVHLHLFEGINTPLIMSAIAIASGVALFLLRKPIIGWLQRMPELNPVSIYNWLFNRALPDTADGVTRRLQNGQLRLYMIVVILAFTTLTMTLIFIGRFSIFTNGTLEGFDWMVAVVCVMLMVGSIVGIIAPTRLSAIVVLGIEGALLSLLFAVFGAPDLAFTQLMIEVISLVLFVLAFHFLPDAFVNPKRGMSRAVDILVSVAAGITITAVILVANATSVANPIGFWYVENAVRVGQGHNVVNVILVDFRGLDTLGEISVLVIAAAGVTALLRLRPSHQPRGQYVTNESEIAELSERQKQISALSEETPS